MFNTPEATKATPKSLDGIALDARYTIIEVAQLLGMRDSSVRTAIRQGKLESELYPIEGRDVERHEITGQAILDWRDGTSGGVGKRSDGRMRFTFYLNEEEKVAVEKIFKDLSMPHVKDADLFFRGNVAPSTKAAKAAEAK